MIPLRDENPTTRPPIVTILIIVACAVVFFFVQPGGRTELRQTSTINDTEFTFERAAIPCEVTQRHPLSLNELNATVHGNADACDASDHSRPVFPNKQVYLALIVSMFMHAGLLHIGGNMLFFWVFGNNIEDEMGPFFFAAFYLVGGIVASLGHVFADPHSTVPVVGASGAIAAVMGAYLVLFPRARIHSLILLPPFVFFRRITAWIVLVIWLVTQFFVDPNSGVAWVAHVTGFAFGVLVALILRTVGTLPRTARVTYDRR